jgi:hypothetical protein
MSLVALVVVPTPTEAFELSSGVGLGGLHAGTVPRLAANVNGGISWRTASGFLFAVHDLFNVLPPIDKTGLGIYNQTSAAIGYASADSNFSAGPSFSVYSIPACGTALCGRVFGLAPGGHAQASIYISESLGVSVSGNVDWVGGGSLVLPGGVAATVVAGPVLRWSNQ